MIWRRISEAQRWQIIGMHTTGMSFKTIGRRWFQTVSNCSCIVDRHLLGSQCCLSTGLVANGIRLTKRYNALSSRSDVTRGLSHLDESWFLLHVSHGQMRVWRHKNTAYTPKELPANCLLRWSLSNGLRCISHVCKLVLVTIQGNITGVQYITHVLKFQPRRAKHHAKRDHRCRSANSGRIITLLDLSLADFRRFLTVLWVFKSGVLIKLFIFSKHGTKANIRSTKMANIRHAYNRDVL
jgi:hypothetical protein